MQEKIVITGGPGTGKSSILNELIRRKHFCMPEISREITLEARESGTEQLFLSDPLLFSEILLKKRVQQFLKASESSNQITFFDRAIPDIISYLNYAKIKFPNQFLNSAQLHQYSKVFILPPWKKIYTSDNERYESYDEAVQISHFIKQGYQSLGYNLIEIPIGTIKSRVEFILKSLK